MITAEEAKTMAIKVVTYKELADIEKLIIEAAGNGEFSIRVPELSTPTISALEELGYKTDYPVFSDDYPNDRTNGSWEISW